MFTDTEKDRDTSKSKIKVVKKGNFRSKPKKSIQRKLIDE
jgi:hypothetical protein